MIGSSSQPNCELLALNDTDFPSEEEDEDEDEDEDEEDNERGIVQENPILENVVPEIIMEPNLIEENVNPGSVSYIPNVNSDAMPFVGKLFNSSDDAYDSYNNYARDAGFSTRRHSGRRDKGSTEYRSRTFTCSKQGDTNKRYQEKEKHAKERSGERKRGKTRCFCTARLTVKKTKTGDAWIVSKFTPAHSHPLTSPARVQFLPSHRKVTPVQKCLLDQLSQVNIPTCKQYQFLAERSGGLSSMGCQERDIRNVLRDKRRKKFGHDAKTLVEFFECEKEVDENYYFKIDTEDGVFDRCFWADSTSRSAYSYFGDVVVFDTTYNTNTYGMILAPFVGVNHHRQTVMFGCGLLSNERTDSFIWLFSQFLEAMPVGVAPKVIITDQDQAIGAAIAKVFPPTVHRLCLWHITNKFSEKLGPTVYNSYKDVLSAVVYRSETPEEFVKKWGELMSTTVLGGNDWLRSMYVIREKWVPAYVKHFFAAGMTSSQRVESNHSFLKSYVIRKNCLSDFIIRYKIALRHQRHVEMQADHIDKSEVPLTSPNNHIENQMVRVYTKAIFLLFQKEVHVSSNYDYLKNSSTPDAKVYQVSRFDAVNDCPRHVTWNTDTDITVSCSCKLFEFTGYLCRHILCLFYRKGVRAIPDRYILSRWTKHVKLNPVFPPLPESARVDPSISVRDKMIADFMDMAQEVYMFADVRNFVEEEMSEVRRKAREMIAGMGPTNLHGDRGKTSKFTNLGKTSELEAGTTVQEGLIIQDPISVRAKGSGKRLQSSKEKAMSKSKRKCGSCQQPGHNKLKCPQIIPRTVLVDEDYHPDMSEIRSGVGDAEVAGTIVSQGADNYSGYQTILPGDPFLGCF